MGLNLAATISLDGSQFERGMQRVGASAAAGIKNLIVGAVGVYTLESALSKTVETADELVTTSKRLGIGVEQLQVLRQAAKDNNVEFTALAATFEKIDIARAKALGGGTDAKKFLKDFSALGVSREMLLKQTAAQLFTGAISQTAQTTNPEQIALQLRDVLGKSFGGEIAVLGTNFEELGGKMKSMGAIMDTTSAVQLKAFKDEMGLIGQLLTSQLAPYLIKFADGIYYVSTILGEVGTFWGTVVSALKNGEFDLKHPIKSITAIDKEAVGEADNYFDDRTATMDAFKAKQKGIADELNNPKPPAFDKEQNALKVNNAKSSDKIESDSLTKVGNFLGTSRGAIDGAQQQMAVHAEQTANNTASMVNILNAMLGKMIGVSGSTVGQFENIFFPIN